MLKVGYDIYYLNVIDLDKNDFITIKNLNLPEGMQYKFLNCAINKLEQMNSYGYETVSTHPFTIGTIAAKEFNINVS